MGLADGGRGFAYATRCSTLFPWTKDFWAELSVNARNSTAATEYPGCGLLCAEICAILRTLWISF